MEIKKPARLTVEQTYMLRCSIKGCEYVEVISIDMPFLSSEPTQEVRMRVERDSAYGFHIIHSRMTVHIREKHID